jgi:hypothetical protein
MFAIGYGIPPNGPLRAIRLAATPLAREIAAHLGTAQQQLKPRLDDADRLNRHDTSGFRPTRDAPLEVQPVTSTTPDER